MYDFTDFGFQVAFRFHLEAYGIRQGGFVNSPSVICKPVIFRGDCYVIDAVPLHVHVVEGFAEVESIAKIVSVAEMSHRTIFKLHFYI